MDVQYALDLLLKSSAYLLKLWNAVSLTVLIVLLQTGIALLTAFGFSRDTDCAHLWH